MTLRDLINGINVICLNHPVVREFGEGDIYNHLNNGEHQYPCTFLTISNVSVGEGDTNTITGSLFYVDRLLNDNSNRLSIQSIAISTLNVIASKIDENLPCTMTVNEYQPFTEKFADWTAGAYATFELEFTSEIDCGEYDEISLEIRENGVYSVLGYDTVVINVAEGGVSEDWVKNYTYDKETIDQKIEEVGGVTMDQVDSEIDSKLTDYPTKLWVKNQGYLTEHQSLDGYAKEEDIPTKVSQLENDKNYLTEHQKLKTINGESIIGEGNIVIQGSGEGVSAEWVKNYAYSKQEVDDKIPSLTGYATEQWVENKHYLTEHQSLEGYATEEWTNNQGFLKTHQDLSEYAKKSEIPTVPSKVSAFENDLNYITAAALDGYATEQWVEDKGYLTEHQDLSDYALKSEIPSLTGYATEQWVENKHYLTEHQDLSEYALKSELPTVPSKVSAFENDSNYITIAALDGYATEEWTNNQGFLKEHQSLDGYATEQWVENKGYLTEHQDISGKFDKSSVWTGTEEEWNLLSPEQQATYIIALIK